ncbi:hypothetical protein AA313_de0208611 [Arthrobotrys entomopaga]|nr:hypothetical protein AA313_de0208611 [Arthrobotrys entomopaga]
MQLKAAIFSTLFLSSWVAADVTTTGNSNLEKRGKHKLHVIQAIIANHKPAFVPNSLTNVDPGDVLRFVFNGTVTHSVVRGDFNNACNPVVGPTGFYSGMQVTKDMANGPIPMFDFVVKDKDPIFVYCSAGKHCQEGMVAAINPTEDQSLDAYTSKCADASSAVSPKAPNGGFLNRIILKTITNT